MPNLLVRPDRSKCPVSRWRERGRPSAATVPHEDSPGNALSKSTTRAVHVQFAEFCLTTITAISYMSAEERYAAGITWQIITRQVIIQPSANYRPPILRPLHSDNRIRAQVRIVPAKHLAHSKNPLSTRRIAYHIAGEPYRAAESLVTDDAGGFQ